MTLSDPPFNHFDSSNAAETNSRRRILFIYSFVLAGAIWTINCLDSALTYPAIIVVFGTGYVVLKAISEEARHLWRATRS